MTIRKALARGFLGFPLGIAICYTITVLISLINGDGQYASAVPSLVETMGNEIRAVAFQWAMGGLLGFSSAMSSAIWEAEHWSLTKQTIIHFLVLSLTMLPIAYFCHWVDHTVMGVFSYFGIFVLIYIILWVFLTRYWRINIKKINERLKRTRKR